jgi:Flp pilus assembly pilin Flp
MDKIPVWVVQGVLVGIIASAVLAGVSVWKNGSNSLDASLPWIAAVGGILAAVGGFWAAIATSVGSAAALDQVNLERKPVLVLTCAAEFLLKDQADRIEPPRQVLFIQDGGGMLIDVDSNIPTYTQDGRIIRHPPLFQRCVITNGGRLPLVAIALPITFVLYEKIATPPGLDFSRYSTASFVLNIATLAPSQSYTFAVANASGKRARFAFDRSVQLTRIDTEKSVSATLFVDRGVVNAESFILDAYDFQAPPTPPNTKKGEH